MNFKVTYHAQIRSQERNISLDTVKAIIISPNIKRTEKGQIVVSGLAKKRPLRVIL